MVYLFNCIMKDHRRPWQKLFRLGKNCVAGQFFNEKYRNKQPEIFYYQVAKISLVFFTVEYISFLNVRLKFDAG